MSRQVLSPFASGHAAMLVPDRHRARSSANGVAPIEMPLPPSPSHIQPLVHRRGDECTLREAPA